MSAFGKQSGTDTAFKMLGAENPLSDWKSEISNSQLYVLWNRDWKSKIYNSIPQRYPCFTPLTIGDCQQEKHSLLLLNQGIANHTQVSRGKTEIQNLENLILRRKNDEEKLKKSSKIKVWRISRSIMSFYGTFWHFLSRKIWWTNYFSIKNIEKIKKCVPIVTMSDESKKLSSHAKIA